ncbi:2,3-bisphosphoglycerate-dependent phosphoglycerate mutase [Candidatus Pelagibacter sp.]|nr:2,3-bisphosphoglycerate-dependent phosphoglycerate mutase [Candidatus Pelagibacter sp.]
MSHLILVRHGQSVWNLENRFTGWVDVELSKNGREEASKAGKLIKNLKIDFGMFYTSYLKRANETLNIILKEINVENNQVVKAWELNERHYGNLTGLNKDEMKKKLSEEKVHQLRRSWDIPPEKLDKESPYHPLNNIIYKDIPKNLIPDTESLKDTYDRVIPYYKSYIMGNIKNNVLISAHGNSIRALCKFLFNLDNKDISKLEIPTGNPLILKFENGKIISANYLDKERSKNLIIF